MVLQQRRRDADRMIRVAIVDDHPAVRLGLTSALKSEPGLVPVGIAGNAAELQPMLYRTRPDVLLLDHSLPDGDGLTLCHAIKGQPPAPAVLVYSAFADASMTVPAIVAGADGVLDKGLPARELFEAIRRVHAGESAIPSVSPAHLQVAAAALQERDLPILGMLMERTPVQDIATVLRADVPVIRRRTRRMLGDMLSSVSGARRLPAATSGPGAPAA
jgi:DNA-binding NarL/FixJ family response regulator